MWTLPFDRARWPTFALAASAVVLAIAYGFEYIANLGPCQMCWWQRYVYFAAGPIALLGMLAAWRNINPGVLVAVNLMLALAFAIGAGIAFWHAGVEWKVFPGPATCSLADPSAHGDKTIPLAERIAKATKVVSCSDALWRLPNADWGLSMAGYNFLISTGLALASLISAFRSSVSPRSDTANEAPQVLSPLNESGPA
jgi:disulfide bond formation protein DsbB